MRIIKHTIAKIENVLQPNINLPYLPSDRLFILNYVVQDYYHYPDGRKTILSVDKTSLFDEKKREFFHLIDGLDVLGITARGKLYSRDRMDNLYIYDVKHHVPIKNIPMNFSFGYQRSYIMEDDVNKLYIAGSSLPQRGFTREDEGLLVVDLKEDQIIKKMDLDGSPSSLAATRQKDKLFITVSGYDRVVRLTTIDTSNNEILESVILDFYPLDLVLMGNHLLMLNTLQGIGIFDIQTKRIIDMRSLAKIYGITPIDNRRYCLVLLQIADRNLIVRLALYDLETNSILCEEQVSGGHNLKTFDDGRIFFTEIKDNALFLNEIEIEGVGTDLQARP